MLQFNGISAGGLGPAVPSADRQENIPAFHSCCFHLVMSLSAISSSWNGHRVTTPGAQRPNPAFLMGIGWEKGWNGRGFRIDGQEAPELCFVAFPRRSVQGLAAFGVIMHGYPLGFIGMSFGIHRDILWDS